MKRLTYILLLLTLLPLAACRDELELPWDQDVTPGLPARISLRWAVPQQDMRAASRATLSEDEANKVEDLWVGVFSVEDDDTYGHLVYHNIFEGGTLPVENGCQGTLTIDGPNLSGRRVMVALANVRHNLGIIESSTGGSVEPQLVANLLTDNLTLSEYSRMATCLTTATQVEYSVGDLMMSGNFSSKTHPQTSNSDNELFPDAGIPDTYQDPTQLPGYMVIPQGASAPDGFIRLVRHVAYVKFNITSNPLITLDFNSFSWQVMDLPQMSLMAERHDINAGDLLNGWTTHTFGESLADNKTVTGFKAKAEGGGWSDDETQPARSFDFYIFNNRRTALDHVTTYGQRDQEFKTDGNANLSGPLTSAQGRSYEAPFFRSLVADNGGTPKADQLYRNRAPYVRMKIRMSYWVKPTDGEGDLTDPDKNPGIVAAGTPGAYQRNADVTAIVHLGYCDGTGADRARDFNVHRNTKYAYNIDVQGVNNIRVEALSQTTEAQPAWSGDVTDAQQSFSDLDSHYSVFNVKLPGTKSHLYFTINAEYGVEGCNKVKIMELPDTANCDRAFWRWIKLVPTTGANVLAPYPGDRNECGYGQQPYIDLAQLMNQYGNPNGTDTDQWYTVFIDENVYPKLPWKEYVNNGGRSCTIRAQPEYVSADQSSSYSHSIVYIQQNSISTFYSVMGQVAEKAIGVEKRNETFGLNMLWEGQNPSNGLSSYSGRYNLWQHLNSYSNYSNDSWDYFVDQTTLQQLQAANPNGNFGISLPSRTEYLPSLVPYENPTTISTDYAVSPDDKRVYDVREIALSRNRDLNGNGTIDPDEIRWVVPTTYQMENLVLGTRSLPTPLVDYNTAMKPLPYLGWPGELKNGIHHFVCSDGKMLWADQHMVISPDYNEVYSSNYQQLANTLGNYWQVRCVRVLGTDFSQPPAQARDYDPVAQISGDVVTAQYLNRGNIRQTYQVLPVPYHGVSSYDNNSNWRSYEFGNLIPISADAANVHSNNDWRGYLATHNPAASLNVNGQTGWRVATFQELALVYLTLGQNVAHDRWGNVSIMTCTSEEFLNPTRTLGYVGATKQLQSLAGPEDGTNNRFKGTFYVLPVRDIP